MLSFLIYANSTLSLPKLDWSVLQRVTRLLVVIKEITQAGVLTLELSRAGVLTLELSFFSHLKYVNLIIKLLDKKN